MKDFGIISGVVGASTYGTYKGLSAINKSIDRDRFEDFYISTKIDEEGGTRKTWTSNWKKLSEKEKIQFIADHMEEIAERFGKNGELNNFQLPAMNLKIK